MSNAAAAESARADAPPSGLPTQLPLLVLIMVAMRAGLTVAELPRAGVVSAASWLDLLETWLGWHAVHSGCQLAVLAVLDRVHWPRRVWLGVGLATMIALAPLVAWLGIQTPTAQLAVERGMTASADTLYWYLVWISGLTGVLLLAIHDQLRQRAAAERDLQAIQQRARHARRLRAQAQLKAIQARVDPRLLFDLLDTVRDYYARDTERAERVLDALIGFLRAALPRLRGSRSALSVEVELVACYAQLMALAFDDALAFDADLPPALADVVFPPGVLLPMASRLLAPGSGAAQLRLRVRQRGPRLSLRLEATRALDATTLAQIQQVLRDLYDDRGWLRPEALRAGEPAWHAFHLEVPLESDREPHSS